MNDRPLRIYVASSWRNLEQPYVVTLLREAGHEVYDFRHPNLGLGSEDGFRWSDIDAAWESWTPYQYRDALAHPIAVDGFAADKGGMDWADVCVMVTPCGRSAHSEAAYMAGQGKPSFVLLRPGEPELMYGLFTSLCITFDELLPALDAARPAIEGVEEGPRLPKESRGDVPCQDCGTPDNPVWFTDNVLWNEVMGNDGGILCPQCFIARAEARHRPTGWNPRRRI